MLLHKRGIYDSKPAEQKYVCALCSIGSLKDNYIFVYLEEDKVNTCLTSGCYVEKLNNNLVLFVWLDLNVENIKQAEISRFCRSL